LQNYPKFFLAAEWQSHRADWIRGKVIRLTRIIGQNVDPARPGNTFLSFALGLAAWQLGSFIAVAWSPP